MSNSPIDPLFGRTLSPAGPSALRPGTGAESGHAPAARTVPDASGWDPDAAEELTFQFSDGVEAAQRTLERRVVANRLAAIGVLKIHAIHRILQLMAGREGYLTLRQVAYEFAKAYASGDPDADRLLEVDSLDEAHRLAVRRMALDILERNGDDQAAGRMRQQADPPPTEAGPADLPIPAGWLGEPGAAQAAAHDDYFQAIGTAPSLRSLFDAIVTAEGIDHARQTLMAMQSRWATSVPLRTLQDIAAIITVSRLLFGISTLVASGREFVGAGTAADRTSDAAAFNCARWMLDLTASTVPGPAIERLLATAAPTAVTPDLRSRLLALLRWLASRWSVSLWTNLDQRAQVLAQLARRGATSGRPRLPARGARLTRESLLEDWQRRESADEGD